MGGPKMEKAKYTKHRERNANVVRVTKNNNTYRKEFREAEI
jgi:hypothetical protein